MKIVTKTAEYDVDLKAHTVSTDTVPGFSFHQIANAYVGSPAAKFLDELGDTILTTDEVIGLVNDPNAAVSGEEGNVVFLTNNSTYEVNQEQKLFRRLAGVNAPRGSQPLDGDWEPYEEIAGLEVGCYPVIFRPGKNPARLTRVREIRGTLISPPSGAFQ